LPKYSNSYKAPQRTSVARSGGLKSWFKKPEERQPQTMGEWMLQGRPK
jgi:hypothetical protein